MFWSSNFCAGASIRASKSLRRHVIAFECDTTLYKQVLLPLLLSTEEVESTPVPVASPKKKRSVESDDEPERKTAPKRSCK